MNTKRKRIFALITILILILIILIAYSIFSLKNVTVIYEYNSNYQELKEKPQQNYHKLTEDEKQKIIKDSGFKKGSIILTSSKKRAIQNIERENPNIKVINIEKIFPSRIKILVFKINYLYIIKEKNGEKYTLLDENFNYLEKVDATKDENKYIEIKNFDIDLDDLKKKNTSEYLGIDKEQLNFLKSLQNEFNFSDYSTKTIENRERYKNLIKNIYINKKEHKITIETSYSLKIEYQTNYSNINEQIKKSFEVFEKLYENEDSLALIYGIENTIENGIENKSYTLVYDFEKSNWKLK